MRSHGATDGQVERDIRLRQRNERVRHYHKRIAIDSMALTDLIIKISALNTASGPLGAVSQQIRQIGSQSQALRTTGLALMGVGAAVTAVGAAIGYGLKSSLEAAAEVQTQIARLRDVVPAGIAGVQELALAQKAAAEYSIKHAVAQKDVLRQLYLGKSAGLSMTEAIQSQNAAAALAIGLGGDLEETQRTLNLAYINFRSPALGAAANFKMLSDVMAAATAKFDYRDVSELRSQLELAAPTALAAGMGTPEGMKDMVAVLADFTRHGLTGSVAGAAFEESLHGILKMSRTLGIALVHNKDGGLGYMHSLEMIRKHFIALYGSMSAIPTGVLAQIQKTFGIRGLRALLIDPAEVESMRAQLNNVNGAAAQFQKNMESTPGAQWAIFTNNLKALEITIGKALTPAATGFLRVATSIVQRISAFATAHPQVVKFAVLFAGFAAAALVAVGAVTALIGGAMVLASGVVSFPITAAIIGIGVAIAGVVAAIITWFPKIQQAGINIIKMLAHGIESGAHWAYDAIKHVVGKIREYLPFSPAKVGPLKDLNRVKVVETLADNIKPSPAVRAMRTVAAALTIAMPIGGLVAPAIAKPLLPEIYQQRMRATASAPMIQIDARVTINGPVVDEAWFRRALLDHRSQIAEIIKREIANADRTGF